MRVLMDALVWLSLVTVFLSVSGVPIAAASIIGLFKDITAFNKSRVTEPPTYITEPSTQTENSW